MSSFPRRRATARCARTWSSRGRHTARFQGSSWYTRIAASTRTSRTSRAAWRWRVSWRFAPDALYPLGGYPGDEDKARELFSKLDQAKTHNDFLAAADYLKHLPGVSGRIGVVGFCYGGGIANFLATRLPDLGAAVPFYGAQPKAEDAAHIKAPLMLHYAGEDERIDAGWPAYEAALKAAGVRYQVFIYPGVQHGFNNDTTPRYDAAAAKLAWQRTMDFFKENLRG